MIIALYIVIGIVIVSLLLKPLLQVIVEKPRISVQFGSREKDNTFILLCEIYNLPITSKLLKWYHIKRKMVENIVASFFISEMHSQEVVFPGIIPKIVPYIGSAARSTSLPATVAPVMFGVVYVDNKTHEVKPFGQGKVFSLGQGIYTVSITLTIDSKEYNVIHAFSVSNDSPYAEWKSA